MRGIRNNTIVICQEEEMETIRNRFFEHPERHPGVEWDAVEALLGQDENNLRKLEWLEQTCGEPDVIVYDGKLLICDCSKETPKLRRSLCYDGEARLSRKKNPPESSAIEEAENIGLRLMTEAEYYHLQTLGEFDLKTSSWIDTPQELRSKGGALFCERRYGRVFTFHNGADSYYSVRGFRCALELG